MASKRKSESNRRNATRSTGPQSKAVKEVAKLNAVKHGLLSEVTVLPGLEQQEEWDAHLRETLKALAPVGHIQEVLAQRVALLLWRLRRVARQEGEWAMIRQEEIDDQIHEEHNGPFAIPGRRHHQLEHHPE